LLIGRLALAAAVGLIGWNFFGGRREVLKPDGGRVVTVMDFGQSFPLDPLPSADDTGNSGVRRPAHLVDSAMFCDSDDTHCQHQLFPLCAARTAVMLGTSVAGNRP
jgi:hypothetical protein